MLDAASHSAQATLHEVIRLKAERSGDAVQTSLDVSEQACCAIFRLVRSQSADDVTNGKTAADGDGERALRVVAGKVTELGRALGGRTAGLVSAAPALPGRVYQY